MELINAMFKRAIKGDFQLLYCLKAISHSCYLLESSCKMVCKNYSRASRLAIGVVGVQASSPSRCRSKGCRPGSARQSKLFGRKALLASSPLFYIWTAKKLKNQILYWKLHVYTKYNDFCTFLLELNKRLATRSCPSPSSSMLPHQKSIHCMQWWGQ